MDQREESPLRKPLNKILDMLHSTAKAYTQLQTYQDNQNKNDCLCNISSRREQLARELEEQMIKENILIDKRVEAATRHAYPGRDEEVDAIHSFTAMDSKLIEEYEQINYDQLSDDMKELLSDHVTNFKADKKEVENLV